MKEMQEELESSKDTQTTKGSLRFVIAALWGNIFEIIHNKCQAYHKVFKNKIFLPFAISMHAF